MADDSRLGSFKNCGQGHHDHDDDDIPCQEGIIPSFVNLFYYIPASEVNEAYASLNTTK